jgi:hypothetical protein
MSAQMSANRTAWSWKKSIGQCYKVGAELPRRAGFCITSSEQLGMVLPEEGIDVFGPVVQLLDQPRDATGRVTAVLPEGR